MPRRKNNYVGMYTNKQAATGYGSKKQVEALAMLISHPGLGVGRKVCVYREPASGERTRTRVSCWTNGTKER